MITVDAILDYAHLDDEREIMRCHLHLPIMRKREAEALQELVGPALRVRLSGALQSTEWIYGAVLRRPDPAELDFDLVVPTRRWTEARRLKRNLVRKPITVDFEVLQLGLFGEAAEPDAAFINARSAAKRRKARKFRRRA